MSLWITIGFVQPIVRVNLLCHRVPWNVHFIDSVQEDTVMSILLFKLLENPGAVCHAPERGVWIFSSAISSVLDSFVVEVSTRGRGDNWAVEE